MLVDQHAHVTSVARRYPQVKFQRVPLTLFRVGAFRPPSGFSCAIAKRRKTENLYLVTFS